MKMSNTGFGVMGRLAAIVATCSAVVALCACGTNPDWGMDGGGTNPGTSSGGASSGGLPGPVCDDAGHCTTGIVFTDGSAPSADGGDASTATIPAIGVVTAGDCMGCTFPPLTAPSCAASAPSIKLVYPNDTVLVPPNLNVISVQWTPFGPPFSRFEVDFTQSQQSPNTDWRVITSCTAQTTDMQTGAPGTPSGGCELKLDPPTWSALVGANRGLSNPISITVRGTTDGTCASTSANTIRMSVAEQDLVGTYYYWKSTVSAAGVGGQIWAQAFGDLTGGERDVTSAVATRTGTLNATCNGCHALSRDGSRMIVYSDDNDSDDEYSDIAGSFLDMTTMPNATELGVGAAAGNGGGMVQQPMGGQPPGFSTLNPLASFYVTSNGMPLIPGSNKSTTSGNYPAAVPTNGWSEWNGMGAWVGPVTVGAANLRPTMPDWSIDGTTVVFVEPSAVADWDPNGSPNRAFTGSRDDDDHMFGGSLYTVGYLGAGAFGNPTVFLQSGGENNYYPSYSPDQPMSYIIFNRAPLDMSTGSLVGCTTGNAPMCPNDSFSNPAARLMLIQNAANSTPIDMQRANGSSASAPVPWSNSYPRWAPFVQNYHGNKILWFTFSSTRDYGVRVLNHKTNPPMYQCYPADAYETPGGAHSQRFAPECQEPQLWMAPITFTEAQGATMDPSGVAFWIPYQDITTHNHTAQWTQQVPQLPPGQNNCTCGMQGGACGPANGGCPCCSGHMLVCSGNGKCIPVAN